MWKWFIICSLICPSTGFERNDKSICRLEQSSTKGIDGIDGKILRLSAPFITDTITYRYNLIIEKKKKNPTGLLQSYAKIIPLYQCNDKSESSNCRSLSILSVLSKPVERHVNEHIMKHFQANDLLHKNQSVFRLNHSCHTALTELTGTLLSKINKSQLCGALFIDFAKAFDVISHDLLLKNEPPWTRNWHTCFNQIILVGPLPGRLC